MYFCFIEADLIPELSEGEEYEVYSIHLFFKRVFKINTFQLD